MDIDFSLVLVCLVAACGAVWLLDSLLVKGGRIKAAQDFEARAGQDTRLSVGTNHGKLDVALNEIGLEPINLEAGGLERKLSVQRLPDSRLPRVLNIKHSVSLTENRDDPIWIAVTTEDGFQAWSSPIYFV